MRTHQELEALKDKKISTHYKVKANFETVTKDVDMSKRIVKSIANTYNYLDNDGDVLLPGAASKSIAENGPDSNGAAKIKNVKDHVITDRIGKPIVLDERDMDKKKVLYGESKMLTTTLGDDMLIEYQEGVIDQHSIGFQYVNIELLTADDKGWSKMVSTLINPKAAEEAGFIFPVSEIRMFEWSPVSFGSNDLTPYLGVKSGNKEGYLLKINNRLDLLYKQLSSGRQSDFAMFDYELEIKQLKQIISELFITEPSIKDTLLQRRLREDTQKGMALTVCPHCMKQQNYSTVTENPKCEDCGQFLYKTPATTEDFDLMQAIRETTFF